MSALPAAALFALIGLLQSLAAATPLDAVEKDCPPCETARKEFEDSKARLVDALDEQQQALQEAGAIKFKGSEEHAAAVKRAEDAGRKVDRLEGEMTGASDQLRQALAKHEEQARAALENYKAANEGTQPSDPKLKELERQATAATKAADFHDDAGRDTERNRLRDEIAENQRRIADEQTKRQEAEQVVGAKPPSGGRFNPPAEPAKAKEYLDKVIQEDPNSAAALGARASANFKLGNNAAACADAKAALSQNPNHEEAFGIKQLACNSGKVAEPKPMMQLAQKPPERAPEALPPPGATGAPRPPPPTMAAASQAAGAKAPGEPGMGTVALTREVGSDNAAESAIHSKAAAANLMGRNYKAAAAEADRALALNPRNAHARLMRATARNGMKNYRGALEDAEEGLKLAPKNIPLLNTKAQAQIKLKDYKGALDTATEILDIDPTNAAALAQKAYALGGLGDREAMLDALRRAASMDPRFQSSLDSAMNPPANADALFYFPGEEVAAEKAPDSKKGGFPVKIVLAGLFAGGLILLIILKPSAPAAEAGVAPAAAGPVSTAPGSLLKEQYEFIKEIGQGGMGAVHEAFDKKLDRKVAVKRMRDELKADPRELAHFVQEAKIVSHLSHPYIVGIHDIVEEGGDLFLVLDFVDGQPLSTIIGERKRLTFKEARDIMSYVCQAVEFAHKNKVTHRDLKPSNIMVDKNGFVKVMDFGLAREAKETLSRLTRGDASGTPAYMAPEHHLGGAEPASDIFSLGVCLYEMVTGQLPYRGADLLAAKERRQYTPPRLVVNTLPAGFDELMASLLSPEPGKRPAGAGAIFEALNKLG